MMFEKKELTAKLSLKKGEDMSDNEELDSISSSESQEEFLQQEVSSGAEETSQNQEQSDNEEKEEIQFEGKEAEYKLKSSQITLFMENDIGEGQSAISEVDTDTGNHKEEQEKPEILEEINQDSLK